jgi:hypothetical protein
VFGGLSLVLRIQKHLIFSPVEALTYSSSVRICMPRQGFVVIMANLPIAETLDFRLVPGDTTCHLALVPDHTTYQFGYWPILFLGTIILYEFIRARLLAVFKPLLSFDGLDRAPQVNPTVVPTVIRAVRPTVVDKCIQSQTTYTEVRGAAHARFQPLAAREHGAW